MSHYRNLARTHGVSGLLQVANVSAPGRTYPRFVIRILGVQCLDIAVQCEDHEDDEEYDDENDYGEDGCDRVTDNPTPPTVTFDEPVE